MSVYSIKGKGWRYDFTLAGQRYTEAWFKTKRKALDAEATKRKELNEPPPRETQTPTDMGFLDLVNLRLDHLKAYKSNKHFVESLYRARRWIRQWGAMNCSEMTQTIVERFILERSQVSSHTANQELKSLRSLFNFGIKKRVVGTNPTDGIDFLPVENRVKYVPPPNDIDRVLAVADQDTRDYLIMIRDTVARMSEINRLTWEDVSLRDRYLVLYTRKRKGGHLTPRKVPMTQRLHEILSRRYSQRDSAKPWVFWHAYTSSKTGEKCEGPYKERKRIMKTLCQRAGVRYFRFHGLRHSGASVMEKNNVPIGSIQRILGHSSRRTTEIYLHSVGEAEREAIAALERATNSEKSHTDSHTAPAGSGSNSSNSLKILVGGTGARTCDLLLVREGQGKTPWPFPH